MELNIYDDTYETIGIPEDPSPFMITFAISDIEFLNEAFSEISMQNPWYDKLEICQLKHSSKFFKEEVVTATIFFAEANRWYQKLKELSQIPIAFIGMSAEFKKKYRCVFVSANGTYMIHTFDQDGELIVSQKSKTEVDSNLLDEIFLSKVLQRVAFEFRKN